MNEMKAPDVFEERDKYFGNLFCRINQLYKEYKIPLLTTWIVGFLTHGFMFTNKLPNHDDIRWLFGKGATISSGRWGLELLRLFLADYSMPWLYGVLSILILSIAVCLTIQIFQIRNPVFQGLLGGLVITFPSLTGTFTYMFTAAPYSLAFLMAVGAVALYKKRTVTGCFSAAVLLILSLSIYQSYIALTASFFVILLFQELLERKTEVRVILCRGIRMVIFLLVILVLYYASIRIAMVLTNTEYNDYASNNFKTESINLFGRVYVAYVNFMYFFTSGNWGLINTVPSLVMHLTAILVTGMTVLYHVRKLKVSQIVLLIALVAAFVLSVNCMYLVTSEEAIHTLVLYSFVAVYVLLTVRSKQSLFGSSL